MILKELVFDLPLVPDKHKIEINTIAESYNVSYAEAIIIYNREVWSWTRRKFENDAACICDMVMRLLPYKIVTPKYWKISITCFDKEIYTKATDSSGGVYCIPCIIDYNRYIGLNDMQKKEWATSIILQKISNASCLDSRQIDTFKDTCHTIIQKSYENTFVWKRRKIGNGYVQIRVHYDVSYVDVYVEFLNTKYETISSNELAKLSPDSWEVSIFLGEFTVLSDRLAVLKTKRGKEIEIELLHIQ